MMRVSQKCFQHLRKCLHFPNLSRNLSNNSTRRTISSKTFTESHQEWVDKFTAADIPEPRESAGYIFAHQLKKKTFSQVRHQDLKKKMTDQEIDTINELCNKRLDRMPVQYVIGEWDFMALTLKMKQPVFIPRPETEELAGHLLKYIHTQLQKESRRQSPYKVLEIGCGSGAITLALLHNFQNENLQFTAIDAASHAVDLTKENSRLLGLSDTNKLDVLDHCLDGNEDKIVSDLGPFDVIISNPPYIPTHDMEELALEISLFEDVTALHGGNDGLDVIRNILRQSRDLLTDEGSLWLEVDESHPSLLEVDSRPMKMITYYKDMFGKPRFCHFMKP